MTIVVGRLLPIAFLGFAALGMPRAAEGVAWPSMANDLGQSLGALGWLLAATIGGYFVASIANGEVTRRLGTGRALVTSGITATVSLAGYAVAPSWPVLLAVGVMLGLAGGMIDAAMNAHVALHHDARAMGLLHASFGLGATISPLIMTRLITVGPSGWRWGFGILAAIQLAVTATFWRTRKQWTAPAPVVSPSHRSVKGLAPILGAFLLVGGIEAGAGAWAFTYLTEDLTMSDGSSGLLVGGFFACFTLGRVMVGIGGNRLSARTYLHIGTLGTLAGIGLLWWSPAPWVAGAGLLGAGLGISPLFPILMVITPALVGPERAHDAVGYELGAAVIGAAAIPFVIGLSVDGAGAGAIPLVLAVAALVQVIAVSGRRLGV